jgi:hypothetical protein
MRKQQTVPAAARYSRLLHRSPAMPAILPVFIVVALAAAAVPNGAAAQIVKREPAMGAMKEGERVLVDDGSCPKGQIKEVIGGNHTKVGGKKQLTRQRKCIAR